jgi:4-hydroxy-4-methyl-2-oxoglutarate aldolase
VSHVERHDLHGQIIADFERPAKELVEAFARHETAKVADAMGGYGVMHHEIKPLESSMRCVGTALTVLTRPGDALFVQKAIDMAQAGDVIVIDASGYKDVAVIGERLAYFFKRRGVVGIVCDGAIRDAQGIVDQGPATFARATCIRIFGSIGPGAVNVPVQAGGVPVMPGDIVIGDRDGVVVVPRLDAQRVLDLADAHLAGELARVAEVEAGATVSEVFGIDQKIARWVE